jgi:hypothetical protein
MRCCERTRAQKVLNADKALHTIARGGGRDGSHRALRSDLVKQQAILKAADLSAQRAVLQMTSPRLPGNPSGSTGIGPPLAALELISSAAMPLLASLFQPAGPDCGHDARRPGSIYSVIVAGRCLACGRHSASLDWFARRCFSHDERDVLVDLRPVIGLRI